MTDTTENRGGAGEGQHIAERAEAKVADAISTRDQKWEETKRAKRRLAEVERERDALKVEKWNLTVRVSVVNGLLKLRQAEADSHLSHTDLARRDGLLADAARPTPETPETTETAEVRGLREQLATSERFRLEDGCSEMAAASTLRTSLADYKQRAETAETAAERNDMRAMDAENRVHIWRTRLAEVERERDGARNTLGEIEWFDAIGCFSGDCPHEHQNDCMEAILDAGTEYREKIDAARPTPETTEPVAIDRGTDSERTMLGHAETTESGEACKNCGGTGMEGDGEGWERCALCNPTPASDAEEGGE